MELQLTAWQVFVRRNKISILTKEEQQGMRKVCRLAREVLDIAARALKPGVTTDYIDEIVHKACMERDVSGPRTLTSKLSDGLNSLTLHHSITATSRNRCVLR